MSSGDTTLKFHALYSDHHGWLQGWLRRRVGHAGDAADLAHDTFLRILLTGRTPEADQSRAHLTQVAKGLVIDLRRRRLVEAAYLEALAHRPQAQVPSAEQRALIIEELLLVDRVLGALPAKVRQTFLLSQLDGLGYEEIAQRLEVSVRTVKRDMRAGFAQCLASML